MRWESSFWTLRGLVKFKKKIKIRKKTRINQTTPTHPHNHFFFGGGTFENMKTTQKTQHFPKKL